MAPLVIPRPWQDREQTEPAKARPATAAELAAFMRAAGGRVRVNPSVNMKTVGPDWTRGRRRG